MDKYSRRKFLQSQLVMGVGLLAPWWSRQASAQFTNLSFWKKKSYPTVTYITKVAHTNSANNYTATNVDIGAEASDRKIVIVSTGNDSNGGKVATAVTVGGISATHIVSIQGGGGTRYVGIWIADVPTGTTATVFHQWSGALNCMGFAVYRLTGVGAVYASGSGNTETAGNTYATSLNLPAKGVLIGGGIYNNGTAVLTWNGATMDAYGPYSGNWSHTSASTQGTTETTAATVSYSSGSNLTDGAIVAASWGPK